MPPLPPLPVLSSDIFLQPINRSHFLLHPATHLHSFLLVHTSKTNIDTHLQLLLKHSFLLAVFVLWVTTYLNLTFVPPSFLSWLHHPHLTALSSYHQHNHMDIFSFFHPSFVQFIFVPLKFSCPPWPFIVRHALLSFYSSFTHLPPSLLAPLLSFSTLLLFLSSVSQPAVWQRCGALMEAARLSARIYSAT